MLKDNRQLVLGLLGHASIITKLRNSAVETFECYYEEVVAQLTERGHDHRHHVFYIPKAISHLYG